VAVAVHLVAGWLGTGKTTTLHHLLGRVSGERVAVIVNDFGTAGFDAAVLGAHVRVVPIDGGCLCCTAPRGFQQAVAGLLDEGVERIFVEPTGLARIADLIDTLRRAPFRDRIDLRPVLVVVDPARLDEGRDGAAVADVLVANRCDLATSEQLEAFRTLASGLWPPPLAVIETSFGVVRDDVLTGASLERIAEVPRSHDGWAARTWVWPPDRVVDRNALHDALDGAERVKGLLRTDLGWRAIHRVAGRWTEAPTEWRRDSRLDVIARGELPDGVVAAVERAVGPAGEAGEGLEVVCPGGARLWKREDLGALPGVVADASAVAPGRTGRAVPVAALLDASDAGDGEAVVVAGDGFVTPPTPLSVLRGGWLLLDLPAAQGGPIRLFVPGSRDACAQVKGVVRIVADRSADR
jgi:G3E family GTPase